MQAQIPKPKTFGPAKRSLHGVDAVLLCDCDQLLLGIGPLAEVGADPLDLGHVRVLERKSMRTKRFLRVVDEATAELRVFDGAADHRADHFVAHSQPPEGRRAKDAPVGGARPRARNPGGVLGPPPRAPTSVSAPSPASP